MTAKRYLGLKEIGDLFGVSAATVSKWRTRYAGTEHACPEPAGWIGDAPGWDDPDDWKGWKASLPGRGSGGGPLPLERARQELADALAEVEAERPGASSNSRVALDRTAARYGVDHGTIMAVWARIAEDQTLRADECDARAIATIIRSSRRKRAA